MGFLDFLKSQPVPVVLPMTRIRCEKHQTDIVIYKSEEETLFVDNNQREVAIFISNGKPILKRYILGGCDEDCPTIKQIIEENSIAAQIRGIK